MYLTTQNKFFHHIFVMNKRNIDHLLDYISIVPLFHQATSVMTILLVYTMDYGFMKKMLLEHIHKENSLSIFSHFKLFIYSL